MLTLIDQGQANPSLVTVDKVARALDLRLASGPPPRQPRRTAGCDAAAVVGRALGVGAPAGRPLRARPDAAGPEELFLVLNGALTLEVEGLESVTVKAGGSARLASDRSYAYANHGREPAR
jgi:hypothetical protein